MAVASKIENELSHNLSPFLLKTLLAHKSLLPTFALIWFPIKHRDEKGIRLKSGAIPVAVNPLSAEGGEELISFLQTTVS
jgi:hypothetical protein